MLRIHCISLNNVKSICQSFQLKRSKSIRSSSSSGSSQYQEINKVGERQIAAKQTLTRHWPVVVWNAANRNIENEIIKEIHWLQRHRSLISSSNFLIILSKIKRNNASTFKHWGFRRNFRVLRSVATKVCICNWRSTNIQCTLADGC